MIPGWLALLTLTIYMAAMFALARYGDSLGPRLDKPGVRRPIYLLGCCVFCGFTDCLSAVGLGGPDAKGLLLWLGPIFFFAAGPAITKRMIRFAQDRNISSTSDFVSAHFGNSAPIAAAVTLVTAFAAIAFMALLFQATSASLMAITGASSGASLHFVSRNLSIFVSIAMGIFALTVGTRRLDAIEHQRGLALVIAAEFVIKLVMIAIVGIFITWHVFHGLPDLADQALRQAYEPDAASVSPLSLVLGVTVACMLALPILPPQFQMTVRENRDLRDIRAAALFVPAYTVAIAAAMFPVKIAGIALFKGKAVNLYLSMVAVPLQAHAGVMALVGLIAGFSASTSLIVVTTIVISAMLSNDLVMPIMLHPRFGRWNRHTGLFGPRILTIRRIMLSMIFILACASAIWLKPGILIGTLRVGIGLFAQIAPPCLIALMVRPTTTRSAFAGLGAGTCVWLYTMALPTLAGAMGLGAFTADDGPNPIVALPPAALSGLQTDPFVHALFWSLLANIVAFCLVWASGAAGFRSDRRAPAFAERRSETDGGDMQSAVVTRGELKDTVIHYLGPARTIRAFDHFFATRGVPFDPVRAVDEKDLQFGEHLLASAVGAATSKLLLSLLLKRKTMSHDEILRLVDGVSAELQDRGDLLHQAVAASRHGIALFDRNLQLVAWNTNNIIIFPTILTLLGVGTKLEDLIRNIAEHGDYGPGLADDIIKARLAEILDTNHVKRMRSPDGKVFDQRTLRLPDGAFVMLYVDVTQQTVAEEKLEAENETLERRVRERTEELEHLNAALAKAKSEADEANISKTRFLAAASHDLLQPLNAARLYATSLKERIRAKTPLDDGLLLASNVEESLEAVEDILTALLDISRLDAGATKPELTNFGLDDIFRKLQLEFEPTAKAKDLKVTFVPSTIAVRSDRRLLRRLLQNLVSNAIKYTPEGRVIVGVRREGPYARIDVWDTGLGIPKSKQTAIFREFERLPDALAIAPGVGLGLSIVERASRVLGHEIRVRSKPGRGSVFSVLVPQAPVSLSPNTATAPIPIRQRSLDGLVVAVVENEASVPSGIKVLLGGWDCAIIAGGDLSSIEEAIAARRLRPDVIIADYHLVQGNGLDVIAALRTCFDVHNAILVTADRGQDIRDRASAADIRVLNDPVKPAALRSLLSQWQLVMHATD